jgi:hypothetical protein
MANIVEIIIRANDQSRRGMEDAENSAHRTSSAIRGIATVAAGVGLFEFAKGALDEATEAQTVGKQTETALRSTGNAANVTADQIGNLAGSISKKIAVDDEAIQSSENLLLTFTDVRNEAGKGNDIFNQATMSIEDMTAAMNNGNITQEGLKASTVQLGKALNDPIKGVSALQKVGVTFTAQQKDQIKTLVEHNDKLGAQKIILAEVNKEFGGSAAAAVTPAKQASVAWGNLKETIGTQLLPALAKASQILIPLMSFVAAHATAFLILGIAIGTVAAAVKIWTLAQAALDLVLDASPVTLIVLAIVALVAGILYLATQTQFFQTIWNAVWGFVKAIFWDTFNFITAHWKLIISILLGPFGIIIALLVTYWGTIKSTVMAGVNFVIGAFQFWASLPGRVAGWISSIVGWFAGLPGRIMSYVSGIPGKFEQLGKDIVSGIIRGIGNMGGALMDKIGGLAKGALGKAKSILGIGSPSKVFDEQVGQPIGQGIAQGLDKSIGGIHDSLGAVAPNSSVMAASAQGRAAGASSGAGAGGTLQLEWVGGNAGDELFTWIRKNIRIRGGGGTDSVQRALGQTF